MEPFAGNQDKAFLETWHENLQLFSLTLTSQVITSYYQTISKINEEIEKSNEKKQTELQAKLDRNESEEVISTLENNNELNSIHLKQRKAKKSNFLKLKSKNQYPSEENEEFIHTGKRTN